MHMRLRSSYPYALLSFLLVLFGLTDAYNRIGGYSPNAVIAVTVRGMRGDNLEETIIIGALQVWVNLKKLCVISGD
ncbi:hypothetical protein ECG_09539 [Echinococcus granulosus]|nr:hypothetical protein ECG_09539 [Echinococcus granulosus]